MRLKDVAELNPSCSSLNGDADVAFVPMESLRCGTIDPQTISFKAAIGKYTEFENGDLLIAKVTPCFENGNIAIAKNLLGGIGFGSSEIFVLRPHKDVSADYLFYFSLNRDFKSAACASMCGVGGLKRISPMLMRTYELEMPPLSEQRAIAAYLDEKCGKVDERIKLLEKKVEVYKKLKRSVINEAVTRGMDKNAKLKDSGVDWIGMVPDGWEIKRIESFMREIVEKNSPVRTKNLLSLMKDVGVIPYSEKGLVGNKEKFDYSEYKIAYPNTIVANSMNILIGSVGLCNFMGCVSPVYYVFKSNPHADIKFLNYVFSLRAFQKNLRKYANGILEIRLRVSASDILKQEVAIPDLKEQRLIAAYLDEKCGKIDGAIANIEKQIDAYKRLKRSLINEVVTGKRKVA